MMSTTAHLRRLSSRLGSERAQASPVRDLACSFLGWISRTLLRGRPGAAHARIWANRAQSFGRAGSSREAEQHHVAVADHVLLALKAHLAGGLRTLLAAETDVVIVGDGLHTDETLLEVGMDGARRARRLRA